MINKINLLPVVITFIDRDKKYLSACIKTLEIAASEAGIKLEIILVAGNSLKNLRLNTRSKVIKINYSGQLTYGRAVNLGAASVGGKWFLHLAPDTRVFKNSLANLLRYASADVGVIGPKITYENGDLDFTILPVPGVVSIFLEQSYLYKIFPRLFKHPFAHRTQYESPHPVKAFSSTFLLFNTQAFRKVKGFDGRFNLFHDDTDLTIRIRHSGYKLLFIPKSRVLHLGHKSYEGGNVSGKIHIRSYYIYLTKYYNKTTVYICFLILFWGNLTRLMFWKIAGKIYHRSETEAKIIYHRNALYEISKIL